MQRETRIIAKMQQAQTPNLEDGVRRAILLSVDAILDPVTCQYHEALKLATKIRRGI